VLRRVTHDFETRWHFNSATALLMELVNEIHAQEPLEDGVRPEIAKEVFELLILMLNPMVPHLAEELWEILGHTQTRWRMPRGRSLFRNWRRKIRWKSPCK
jgi:leucyl-tRNA synthetase